MLNIRVCVYDQCINEHRFFSIFIFVLHETPQCLQCCTLRPIHHCCFVLFPAPPEITPFYFSELVEGSRVQAACTVHQGDLPLNLTWLKDGGPVHRATVTPFNAYSTILAVNNVSRYDTGDYTCVATNPVHSAMFTAHLNVNGTPAVPELRSGPEMWP